MRFDPHRRAQFLVGEARIAGNSPRETLWLRSHVTDCAECARYEEAVEGVVRGIKSFAFDVDPAMSARIQDAVATHARKPLLPRRWAVAAVALFVAAAVPLYRGVRDARSEKADALLMERVENRVWRVVPVAMEPLIQPRPEESQ